MGFPEEVAAPLGDEPPSVTVAVDEPPAAAEAEAGTVTVGDAVTTKSVAEADTEICEKV
jgi:hypothetical protein